MQFPEHLKPLLAVVIALAIAHTVLRARAARRRVERTAWTRKARGVAPRQAHAPIDAGQEGDPAQALARLRELAGPSHASDDDRNPPRD
jgi:hypothetical protein